MISQARKAQALTGMLLLVVASALTGSPMAIGIHEECIDQINNDGGNPLTRDGIDIDGGLLGDPFSFGGPDGPDPECVIYPWADGNGETHTPINERYLGDKYESTTFDLWSQYFPPCIAADMWGVPIPDDGSQQQVEQQCTGGGGLIIDPGAGDGPPK